MVINGRDYPLPPADGRINSLGLDRLEKAGTFFPCSRIFGARPPFLRDRARLFVSVSLSGPRTTLLLLLLSPPLSPPSRPVMVAQAGIRK